ncbi:DNA ligase, partial [Candidatus Parcubacteria bacterium]|nr:DNA ligase [Candidatus Parcubacteria bacterium]
MTSKRLAEFFEKLEKTASRNEMTEVLAELFKEAAAAEIDKICYLSLGRLAPRFAAVKFNLAEKMMVRILSQAFGADAADIQKEYKKVGDLGEVGKRAAQSSRPQRQQAVLRGGQAKPKTQNFSVGEVFKRLLEIAEASGTGSQEKKIRLFAELLSQLDPLSVKYIVRVPLEKLRLGFSDVTILDALSWMIAGDKSSRGDIERAYNVR